MKPPEINRVTSMDRDRCRLKSGARVGWMVLCLAVAGGCRSATLTYPYCPVPVLLSRVDRIGATGLSPQGQRMTAVREIVGSMGYSAMGGGSSGNSVSYSSSVDPGVLTAGVLAELPPGPLTDRDELRLDQVDVSAYVSFHLFAAASSATGRTRGTLMRAP